MKNLANVIFLIQPRPESLLFKNDVIGGFSQVPVAARLNYFNISYFNILTFTEVRAGPGSNHTHTPTGTLVHRNEISPPNEVNAILNSHPSLIKSHF